MQRLSSFIIGAAGTAAAEAIHTMPLDELIKLIGQAIIALSTIIAMFVSRKSKR